MHVCHTFISTLSHHVARLPPNTLNTCVLLRNRVLIYTVLHSFLKISCCSFNVNHEAGPDGSDPDCEGKKRGSPEHPQRLSSPLSSPGQGLSFVLSNCEEHRGNQEGLCSTSDEQSPSQPARTAGHPSGPLTSVCVSSRATVSCGASRGCQAGAAAAHTAMSVTQFEEGSCGPFSFKNDAP